MNPTENPHFFLIAGPCAIENRDMVMQTAETLKRVTEELHLPFYFKSSYDKANRTSLSCRGIGMEEGLKILQEVKTQFSLPILTDVHESWQCQPVAEVADVLQIPAFLSRQTDLLQAAARTGKIVNVKKGQFMAPWDMRGAVDKINLVRQEMDLPSGKGIWLTERGSSFGYGRLVVDMTGLVEMRRLGYPVVFDATHSVQQPSSQAGVTGGNREMVPYLIRAALAVGIDGLFLEVHPNPEKAISDAANQIRLSDINDVLSQAVRIHELVHSFDKKRD
ncbi:MAG: 3-deoxy-8-phosphooctulonate synthase [Paludibacteraceae bacterium]|nr:3-deoxy-8-phosphooctulonate synthase [Paludibacteraceae bacterium]